MGCLKGESEVKKTEARYECGKCGAMVKKKDHACKPVKIKAVTKTEKKKGKKN